MSNEEKKNKKKIIKIIKIILLVISFIAITSIIFVTGYFKGIEFAYYLSQIIGIFIALIGGLIAVNSYYTSVKQHQTEVEQYALAVKQYSLTKEMERHKYENARIEKAINLVAYYKDNILCNMEFIFGVYRELGIDDILTRIEYNKMNNFDTNELDIIINEKDIEIIKAKLDITPVDLITTVKKLSEMYPNTSIQSKEHLIKENNSYKKIIEFNPSKIYYEFMNDTVMKTLNNLEYFAIHFEWDMADKDTAYQPLHVSYLKMVRLLYYNIAKHNKSGEQKVFINTISLFNKWKKVAEEQQNREGQLISSIAISGNKSQNI